MKINLKKLLIGVFVIASITVGAIKVFANSSYFTPTIQTATATSTKITISPTASTTLTLDAYTFGTTYALNRAVLLVQHTASTSASVLKITIQYSQDGFDWYDNELTATTSLTTYISDVTTAATMQIFGNTTSSTTLKALPITTSTRFVRAVFSATTATSSIWAQFVPVREIPSK